MQKKSNILKRGCLVIYINMSGVFLKWCKCMSCLVIGEALDGDNKGIEEDQEPKQD